MKSVPRVGVAVLVTKDNKVLFGKRKNAHGQGLWAPPGGHLEFFESFEECAQREVIEETGLEINNIHIVAVTNDVFENEKKYYATIIVQADYKKGDLAVKEPDKCESWQWFSWNNLPAPLFPSIEKLLSMDFSPSKINNFGASLINQNNNELY